MLGRFSLPFVSIIMLALAGCAEQAPQTAAAPPASTASTPAATASAATSGPRDLTGEWRFSMGGKVAMTQSGNRVRGTWSQGNDRCSAGTLYIDARIEGSRLLGDRIDCTRQDRQSLNAQISPDGNAITFDLPGFGRLGLTR